MNNTSNSEHLLAKQYGESKNLDVRIALHNRFSTNKYGWHRWVFDQLLELPEASRILELGCGTGVLWKNNLDRLPEKWQIVLSDISEGMLKDTQNYLQEFNNFSYRIINANQIDFSENTFDAVIANHMLYHVPNLNTTLSEIKRVLKQDGRLFASTMSVSNMAEYKELLKEFDSKIDYPDNPMASIFGLENGQDILSPFFNIIDLKRYNDSLLITEIEPLVDYVLSFKGIGNITEILTQERLPEFKEFIATHIEEGNGFKITKDAGIFIAR